MVFNATFHIFIRVCDNTLERGVHLLKEEEDETGKPGENHRPVASQ